MKAVCAFWCGSLSCRLRLTWCRQFGSEWKLCTWVRPSRQLRKHCRAALESPSCWKRLPCSNRPSRPPFSIPCLALPTSVHSHACSCSTQQLHLPSEPHKLSVPCIWIKHCRHLERTGDEKRLEKKCKLEEWNEWVERITAVLLPLVTAIL